MNELHRQAYLSALGIENYMPRWQLPCAPVAYQCVQTIPSATIDAETIEIGASDQPPVSAPFSTPRTFEQPAIGSNPLADINISTTKPVKVSAASILQQLEKTPAVELKPFALSVWRPSKGFLIIDSRQATLALPTELLLHNMLRALLKSPIDLLQEEVLRWPMIENRFISRTVNDARIELQTWLAVEHELRPVTHLWLMGENAARYLLPDQTELQTCIWKHNQLPESGLSGLVLPSLSEILQQPLLKSRFLTVIQ